VLATAAPAPAKPKLFFQTRTKLWTVLQQSIRKDKDVPLDVKSLHICYKYTIGQRNIGLIKYY
jgi:hypothetical protein